MDAMGEQQICDDPGPIPENAALASLGGVLFLEVLPPTQYHQKSPLTLAEATTTLSALAKFHAACWQNVPLLSKMAAELGPAGSYTLKNRNPLELGKIEGNWEKFSTAFGALGGEFLAQPQVVAFGSRLRKAAEWVASELECSPTTAAATAQHGDYKAMNVFLPLAPGGAAVLIDFASTGCGLGMCDVAMHLLHAVSPADRAGGGEEALVAAYLEELERGGAVAYERSEAERVLDLGVIDYARFMVG